MTVTNVSDDVSTSPETFSTTIIIFITLQQLVFVLACLGNALVIYVFCKYLKFKTATNRFIVNLSVADFMTGISSGLQALYFLIESMNSDMTLCFLRYLTTGMMTLCSQLLVTFTTFDRFIAICLPHRYKSVMTKVVSYLLISSAWLYSTIISSIPFMGANNWNSNTPCIFNLLFYEYFYLISGFSVYIFMLISVIMYMCILHTAIQYQRRIRPTNGMSMNIERRKKIEKDIRSARVMGVVTVSFTVCWAPYYVFHIRYGFGLDDTVSLWFVFLGICNSFINPFIYAWQRPDFRRKCFQCIPCLRKVREFSEPSTTHNFSSNE